MGEWIVVIFAGVSVGLLCGAFVPFMLMPSPNELLRRKHEFLRRKYEEELKEKMKRKEENNEKTSL